MVDFIQECIFQSIVLVVDYDSVKSVPMNETDASQSLK